MSPKKIFFLIFLSIVSVNCAFSQQRIGVVLSGGGVAGFAHIGVLKALEDAEIPIDYIVGSSSGALIGSMYAVGYSPDQIKAYFLSNKLKEMVSGKPSKEERFLLREKSESASMLNFKFSIDSLFKKSLPTNFLTPSYLDYETFQVLGLIGASTGKDFDSLFVPFRCVASDIYKKESIFFKDGDLNAAVRASITYPFYLNPIRIDGKLLFDGGLYDNFPSDLLYRDFPVDYIIGSNVTSNDAPPAADDLIGQISTMLVRNSNFTLPCEAGVIIEPKEDIGTFDFTKVEAAIQSGYDAAQPYIDSIRHYVHKHVSKDQLREERKEFNEKITPLKISKLTVSSYKGSNVSFVEDNFKRDTIKKPIMKEEFKKRYYRTYASPQIKYIYPTLKKNSDTTYSLNLEVTKQKPFEISIGGHFSSRSVNTGYIGLSYYEMGKGAIGLHGENYFGKFYTSTKVKLDYDLPTLFPIRVSPFFVLNRWDYYKSFSTFFEDADPSFLRQNEMYYGLNFGIPTTNNGVLGLNFKKFENKDQYYQTQDYAMTDTADVTFFNGESILLNFELNTLNRRQWASEGSKLSVKFRFVNGKEKSISGTTPDAEYDLRRRHQWVNFSIEGRRYFKMSSFFKIGIYGKAAFNSQSFFSNYTATMLTMNDFSPLPDSRTLFMEEYRAPQFVGGGLNFIFNWRNLLEFRIDPYFFQPIRQLLQHEDNTFDYSNLFQGGVPMVGASLIFHTPFGPLRLSSNWFPKQFKPFVTQLSFGYVIFNDRSIR